MNKTKFPITKKSKSTIIFAGLYIVLIAVAHIMQLDIAKSFGVVEYVVLVLAIGVTVSDGLDIYKINKEELGVYFEDSHLAIKSYWFQSNTYDYKKMTEVTLNEKDITFLYNGKKKFIRYQSQSDLIRIMKQLKDRC